MHHLSEKIIKKNHLSEVIEVIGGRVEEVQLEEKVDVIVSEWMGFYLFHESMLSSVLVARDRFLVEGGVILPSFATLYAAPTSIRTFHRKVNTSWKDMYGFDFSPVADELLNTRLQQQPLINIIPPSDIISDPHIVTVVDMKYADADDFSTIQAKLKFQFNKPDVFRGVTLWFDVRFLIGEDDEDVENGGGLQQTHNATGDSSLSNVSTSKENQSGGGDRASKQKSSSTTFSSSPSSSPTHWKQTTILLPTPYVVSKDETFECRSVVCEVTFIFPVVLL